MILLNSDENKLIVQPENLDPGAAKKNISSMGKPRSIQGALTFVSQEKSQLKTASLH